MNRTFVLRDGDGAAIGKVRYPPLSPFWYSVDTFVPLVNLHQEPRWIPDPDAGFWGAFARGYLYFHIAIGWGVTALFAASITGLVKRD